MGYQPFSRGQGRIGSTLDPLNSFPLSHLGMPSLAAFLPVLSPLRPPSPGLDGPPSPLARAREGAESSGTTSRSGTSHRFAAVPTFARERSKVASRGEPSQGADEPGETRIEAHSPMAARFLAGRAVLWKVGQSKQRELTDGDHPAGSGLCRRAARRDASRNRGGRRRI